jgi:hypothetical protein
MAERLRFCRRCGKELDRSWTGRPREFCSDACKVAAWREARGAGPAFEPEPARRDPLAGDLGDFSFSNVPPKPQIPSELYTLNFDPALLCSPATQRALQLVRDYDQAIWRWEHQVRLLADAERRAREWQRALSQALTPLEALHCVRLADDVARAFDAAGDQARAEHWRDKADALASRVCIGALRPGERPADVAGYVLQVLS